jgi:ribosomal protein S12 methylthiotransferase
MYPSGITPGLVALLASEPRLLPYLDMPIQHGSDPVLRRMRRPERQATIRERAGWLRDAVPDLVLRTTVIVGFPGETDAEFEDMLGLLEELRFERVGAFTYSVEEGTPAAEMPDQVDPDVNGGPAGAPHGPAARDLLRREPGAGGAARAGARGPLVDDDPEQAAEGRTRGQAAEVDGLTRILRRGSPSPGGAVLRGRGRRAPGRDFVEVEIVDALDYDLVARVVSGPT